MVAVSERPDYGLDAPAWFYGSAAAGVLALGVGFGVRLLAPESAVAGVLRHANWPGFVWIGYAAVHLWSSKIGKQRRAGRLLDGIQWRGDEQVLDVGCGHGLMLVEAARRLRTGRAVGVDVWSSRDQRDNRPEATLENARRAGVADRVEVRDADARSLPFADASFDVVLSSLVVHNIRGKEEQARAVREMARVLRPGGRIVIVDIEGTARYAAELHRSGVSEITRQRMLLFVPGTATVQAHKP